MTSLFIAGTDTGVGKTLIASAIIRSLVKRGLRVAAMKPVAAGGVNDVNGLRNDDALELIAASNVAATYQEVNPYCLPAPVSPHIAARESNITIDVQTLAEHYRQLAARSDCVVVEGAGGWLVPISDTSTMADVAIAFRLPVLLVVGLRLGCLNHAALTARAIEASGLPLAGWIGNKIDSTFARPAENLATLERLLRSPPIAVAPWRASQSAPFELDAATANRLLRLVAPDTRDVL